MFPLHQHSFRAVKLLLGALIFLQAYSCALSSSGETCYSRQHRDTIVNVRKALDHQKTIMDLRKIEAERDCILACCSEELKPGIKCNMVVYKPSSQDSTENCYLFHCETEQDCPLMSANPGTNTYDIFKGLTHPSTKGKERVPTLPIMITKRPTTTTQSTSTTTTTTTQPTTTASTTQSSTTISPTTAATSTKPPTEVAIILLTMPVEVTTTSATTTTAQATTTTKVPSTTSATTTTQPIPPPQQPSNPIRPSKKQLKPPKKPEPHGKSNPKVIEVPIIQKQVTQKTMRSSTATTTTTTTTTTTATTTTTTTTTTPAPTTTTTTPTTTTTTTPTTTTTTTPTTTTTTTPTTTTTTTPTTTTTTTPTTTTTSTPATTTTTTPATTTTTTSTMTNERTTIVVLKTANDLKNGDSGPNTPAVALDNSKGSHLMWKNSLAFLVVFTLIILTFVVAVVGRRAMETFDRRHYTRLELNDLHYEI